MKKFASVRFAGVLAASERDDVVRIVASAGAAVTSWGDAANRTYALVRARDDASLERVAARLPAASIATPPHAVLRIVPERADGIAALARTFGDAARARGIVACEANATSLAIEVDARATPLATVVASIEVALRGDGRRIEPVLPLDDDVLVSFAATLLGDPSLDASRLIETYLTPLLERGVA